MREARVDSQRSEAESFCGMGAGASDLWRERAVRREGTEL